LFSAVFFSVSLWPSEKVFEHESYVSTKWNEGYGFVTIEEMDKNCGVLPVTDVANVGLSMFEVTTTC
jgi:hypothetical protein